MKVIEGRRKQSIEMFEAIKSDWEREVAETEKAKAEWEKCLSRIKKMPKSKRPKLPYSTETLEILAKDWDARKEKIEFYLKKISDKLFKKEHRPFLTLPLRRE